MTSAAFYQSGMPMTLTPLFAYDRFEFSVRVGRNKGQGEIIAAEIRFKGV